MKQRIENFLGEPSYRCPSIYYLLLALGGNVWARSEGGMPVQRLQS